MATWEELKESTTWRDVGPNGEQLTHTVLGGADDWLVTRIDGLTCPALWWRTSDEPGIARWQRVLPEPVFKRGDLVRRVDELGGHVHEVDHAWVAHDGRELFTTIGAPMAAREARCWRLVQLADAPSAEVQ